MDATLLWQKLKTWRKLNPFQIAELVYLLHAHSLDAILMEMAVDKDLYRSSGPRYPDGYDNNYNSQSAIAFFGLGMRSPGQFEQSLSSPGVDNALIQILRVLTAVEHPVKTWLNDVVADFLEERSKASLPHDRKTWSEFASLTRQLAEQLSALLRKDRSERDEKQGRAVSALNSWADTLERAIAKEAKQRKPRLSRSQSGTKGKRIGRSGVGRRK
jgi:hypothetical protein